MVPSMKKLDSSKRVYNNCELHVGMYNISECLVYIRHRWWGQEQC